MEIIPADSSTFRSSIEALRDFLPQAQLRISEEGIHIRGMDASHVGFVDYFLSKSDCTSLKVPSPSVIGLNTAIFAKTLSSVASGDKVSLSIDNDKFVITYTNEKINKKAVYTIPTLDITDDVFSLPEITYAACIQLKTCDIATVIKEVAHFGDEMKLRLDEEGFHVSSEGDGGKVLQTLENTEDREMNLTDDFVESSFGTKYISTIIKSGQPLSTTTQIEFDGGQPLRMTFKFGKASHFISYLAPKIMDD